MIKTKSKYELWQDAVNACWGKWGGVITEHNRAVDENDKLISILNDCETDEEKDKIIDLLRELYIDCVSIGFLWKNAYMDIIQKAINNGALNGAEANERMEDRMRMFIWFKQLAIIYENREQYDEAISVCEKAIEYGFVDDGTKGKMPERITRLMQKRDAQKPMAEMNSDISIKQSE